MPDYKEMYYVLFRAQTKINEIIEKAQAEELYVAANDPIMLADNKDNATKTK